MAELHFAYHLIRRDDHSDFYLSDDSRDAMLRDDMLDKYDAANMLQHSKSRRVKAISDSFEKFTMQYNFMIGTENFIQVSSLSMPSTRYDEVRRFMTEMPR